MNMMKPKVAFVVVGWNNQRLLADCFDSIKTQTYPVGSVIYVDNDSSDGSVEWVKQHYPEVSIIAQNHNGGFANGNNRGIELALSDEQVTYVGLLNTDARLDPEWVRHIIDFAAKKPRGACFQGTTLDFYSPNIIDSTHIFTARNGQGTQGNWRNYFIHELGPKKIFGVNAAACLVSRAFIEAQPFKNQLFDEAMYMYLEDVDLAARATIMGWDNYLVPRAVAYHMGSVSAKAKSASFSLYMTFRNNGCMLYKNFPWTILARMTFKLFRGDVDTLISLWRNDRRQDIWPVIKGRAVGFIRLPLFVMKRRALKRLRHIDDDYLWQLMKEGY